MYFGLIVPAYGYAYFAPTILQSFNYSLSKRSYTRFRLGLCLWGFSDRGIYFRLSEASLLCSLWGRS